MLNIYFNNRVLIVLEESETDDFPDCPVLDVSDKPEEIAQALTDFENFDSIDKAVLLVGSYIEFFNEVEINLKYIEAAGGLVQNKKEEALVMYRLDKWDLPKGKIDKGETTRVAALREIEEECGLSKLTISKSLIPTFHTYRLKDKFVLKKTFWFKVLFDGNEKLVPQTEENITDLKWIDEKDINTVLENTYPSIRDIFGQIGWL